MLTMAAATFAEPAPWIQREATRPREATMPAPAAGTWWVGFTEKEAPGKFSALFLRATRRQYERSLRAGDRNAITDLEVDRQLVRKVYLTGAKMRTKSKWFNAVSVEATAAQMAKIISMPEVAFVRPVHTMRGKLREGAEIPFTGELTKREPVPAYRGEGIDYGQSITHLNMIQVPALHAQGYEGQDVVIGVLDTGFNTDTHEAFSGISILGEYDFVQNDSETANQEGDNPSQHNHGTMVLALIAGNKQGQLIGTARNAFYVLAKTETISSETQVEMDNFVAAVEWAEGLGCDVITASLTYLDFDDETEIPFEDLDGLTVPMSLAVGEAYARGVVMVNAVGNNPLIYPGVPNDAFGVISVGQCDEGGERVNASSFGPLVDDRIKPEVMGMGFGCYTVMPNSTNEYTDATSGTSFAAPQVAGAAALLLQANPSWSSAQVRAAILATANQASNPTNGDGWGIMQAANAAAFTPVESSGVTAR